ncbi:MAG TPA: transcription termination factor NusA [Anaerolineae bacterium]|nr:transcription termination factor NusA [Anaerolineae bacterium]
MKSEFALAFNQICAEYSLPKEIVLDAVRAALVTAYRRDWKVASTQNVTAEINLETGLAHIYLEKIVTDTIEDPNIQISLQDARKQRANAELDELLMVDVTPRNFGRIAAQTAKQVITQRLREAERESQYNRVSRQENEIIIGTIQSVSPQGVTLHLDRTEEAHLPRKEQIPGERYTLHQKIRVYVLEVRRSSRGPEISVSRSHPLMLRRLLELEVPEIRAGQVEIKAIAREAGARSKVAVFARQPGLDPVGACVGMRGIRIQTISRELHGERIDVVEWHKEDVAFIASALSLTKVLSVILDPLNPGGRTASVVVLDDQLSLAIGRAGQNARLAAKLTGWRVDIQGATEAALWALEQIDRSPELLNDLKGAAVPISRLAATMSEHEKENYPFTDEENKLIKTVVEAVRNAIVSRRNADRPAMRQARERRSAQVEMEELRREAQREARSRVPEEAYAQALDTLNLSDKVLSNLLRSGVSSVGEIMERLALGDEALLMLEGIGAKALREIKDAIAALGLGIEALEPELVVVEALAETVEPEIEEAAVAEAVIALPIEAEIAETDIIVTEAIEEEVIEAVAGETPEEAVVEVVAVPPEPGVESATETPAEGLFKPETLEIPFEELAFDEDEEEGLDEDRQRSKKQQKRKKGRAMVFDDKTGKTVVVRKHRRHTDVWSEYEDDF